MMAVAVASALAGSILVSPVGAHVTTGVKHLIKHMKKSFYTKQQADARTLRVAYGIDNTDTAPTSNPAVLTQTTITAPAPGFLVIQGSADVYNSTGPEPVLSCYIRLNSTDLESSRRSLELNFSSNSEEDCETHTVAPVPAGNHAVQLRASSSFVDTNYDNKVVSAMWIPFGATGASPTEFGLLRPDRAGGTGKASEVQTRVRTP
jgi:hypothetical protein